MRSSGAAGRGAAGRSLRLARVLHAEASRRADPHIEDRARRGAETSHGLVRRSQGLDGAARRPRSRGGAEAPRPRPRTHDGGRPPLRGHRQPGDGRRDHGALRRAARPRGPRRAGLLRGAPDAGEREEIRGRGAPLARGRGQDPRRAELRGGRRARHRQRSPHGLHGRRPDDAPGRADGAARRSRRDRDHARDAGAGRGLRRGEVARPRAGEGARRGRGGLRGDGGGPGADPPAGRHPARADALRRPRRRAGAAPPRPAARAATVTVRWRRSSARRGWASRASSTSSSTRIACRAGSSSNRFGLLRQGDELLAGDRPPQGLLQDPGPRRPPRGSARR